MTSKSDLKIISLYSFKNEKNNIFHDNWRRNKDIIFKLSVHMYHWIVNMNLQKIVDCFVDDVMGSKNKWKLWTAIALSIFELEKRSKPQNVGKWTGYQKSKFQFDIQISKFWQVCNLPLPFHLLVVKYISTLPVILIIWHANLPSSNLFGHHCMVLSLWWNILFIE